MPKYFIFVIYRPPIPPEHNTSYNQKVLVILHTKIHTDIIMFTLTTNKLE